MGAALFLMFVCPHVCALSHLLPRARDIYQGENEEKSRRNRSPSSVENGGMDSVGSSSSILELCVYVVNLGFF